MKIFNLNSDVNNMMDDGNLNFSYEFRNSTVEVDCSTLRTYNLHDANLKFDNEK